MKDNWQKELLEDLRKNPLEQDEQELCELASLGVIPVFLLEVIKPEIRQAIAQNTNTNVDLLAELATDEDEDVRYKVAANPNTPKAALIHLAGDRNLDVRSAVVQNRQTPAKALERLADDLYESIRSQVVKHPNITGGCLLKLQDLITQDQRESIFLKAARNTDSSEEDLAELAKSKDWHIRLKVAENPQTPENLLEQLWEDEMIYVRKAVAQNPNTSVRLLEKMSNDNTGQRYADGSLEREVCIAVIKNPKTPVAVLERLTANLGELVRQDINRGVPEAIASNLLTPGYILERLVSEEYLKAIQVKMVSTLFPGSPESFPLFSLKESKFVQVTEAEILALLEQPEDELPSVGIGMMAIPLEYAVQSLNQQASEEFGRIQLLVAKNPNITRVLRESLFAKLFLHRNENIRQQARKAYQKLPQEEVISQPSHLPLPSVKVEVRIATAKAIDTPIAILALLAEDQDPEVRRAVAANFKTTPELLKSLAKDVILVRQALAENPHTPINVLEELAQNNLLHNAIAFNSSTPNKLRDDLFERLYETAQLFPSKENLETCIKIAGYPQTSPRLLAQLAEDPRGLPSDPTPRISLAVSRNPNTPVDILEQITQHSDVYISSAFASNPNMPLYLLEKLANHLSYELRSAVAAHPNSSEELLIKLAKDRNDWVRGSVAKNPHTPFYILEELAKDKNMAFDLCKNPQTPWTILENIFATKSNNFAINGSIASNPNTPPEMLHHLGLSGQHESVCKAVVANPNTFPHTLEQMLNNTTVQYLIAGNPRTPVTALEKLAKVDKHIHKQILNNPKAPLSLLETIPEWITQHKQDIERLCYLAVHPYTPLDYLYELARNPESEVRQKVASNPLINVSILEELASYQDVQVRLAVAQNPITPIEILERLIEDESIEVRLAVKQHPQGLPLLLASYGRSSFAFTRLVVELHPQFPHQKVRE